MRIYITFGGNLFATTLFHRLQKLDDTNDDYIRGFHRKRGDRGNYDT